MSSNHSGSVSSSPSHTEPTAENTRMCFSCLIYSQLIKNIILIQPVPAATQDSSVSSGHGAMGHSPAVVQAARESSSPVEYCRDNKKTHNNRGEVHSYVHIYGIINHYLIF